MKFCVIINTKKVPTRIKTLKKFVKEFETKLFVKSLNESLKEFIIINNKAITIPYIILVTRT